MNTFDIIFLILFIISLYQGYKRGLIVELCGIVGIILGIYVAYNFSDFIFDSLGVESDSTKLISYVLIVIAVLIIIAIAARAVSKLLDFTGLGVINKLLGAVASFVKYVMVISMFIAVFNSLNNKFHWVGRSTIDQSKCYSSMITVSDTIFPFLKNFTSIVDTTVEFIQNGINDTIDITTTTIDTLNKDTTTTKNKFNIDSTINSVKNSIDTAINKIKK